MIFTLMPTFLLYFDADILNEYVKEEKEKEEEEKKKTTDCPTIHKILQKKSGEYLFNISLLYLMIVSGCNNMRCFYFLRVALGEHSIRIDHSCI